MNSFEEAREMILENIQHLSEAGRKDLAAVLDPRFRIPLNNLPGEPRITEATNPYEKGTFDHLVVAFVLWFSLFHSILAWANTKVDKGLIANIKEIQKRY